MGQSIPLFSTEVSGQGQCSTASIFSQSPGEPPGALKASHCRGAAASPAALLWAQGGFVLPTDTAGLRKIPFRGFRCQRCSGQAPLPRK